MLYKDGSDFRKHQLPPLRAPSTGGPVRISYSGNFKSMLYDTTQEFLGALLAQPNNEHIIAPAAAVSDLFFHLLSSSSASSEESPDDVDELQHPDAARLVATLGQLKAAASCCLLPHPSPHAGTPPPADEAGQSSLSMDADAAGTAAKRQPAKHGPCCTQPSSATPELLAEVAEAAQRLQAAACAHPAPKLSSSPAANPVEEEGGASSSTGRRSFVLLRRMTMAVLQVLHLETGADCRHAVEKVGVML